MTVERGICSTWDELKARLQSLGFVFSPTGQRMRWGEDGQGTVSTWQSYWALDNEKQTINFYASGEVFPNETTDLKKHYAFHLPLVHMTNDDTPPSEDPNYNEKTKAGFIFIKLLGNGCILYLTPIESNNTDLSALYPSCFIDKQQMLVDNKIIKNNGVVVCTPAESDGYCRYSWRHDAGYDTTENPDGLYPFDSSATGVSRETIGFFRWDIDNMHGYVSKGVELPQAWIIDANMSLSMAQTFLTSGYWSSNIYSVVTGHLPDNNQGIIFRINNQKYIIFTDNTMWRCPVFKIPIEEVRQNINTSTEAYSEYKLYEVDDYCIWNGLLYRCIQRITQPCPFDETYWTITTVYNEMHGI